MAYAQPRSSGRFTAVYRDADNKRQVAGTFDDRERAQAVAEAAEEHARTGRRSISPVVKATTTIGDYFEPWLANHPIEGSTKRNYRDCYRAYIKSRFEHVRVAELEREAVRGLLADLDAKDFSITTQRLVRSVLSAMMRTAMDDGYRDSNPAAGLRLRRRTTRRSIVVFTTEQYNQFRACLGTRGARLLASLIAETGCRPSEAFVLTRGDVELGAAKVHFTKALQGLDSKHEGAGKRWIVADTKTHHDRHLAVTPTLVKALHQWADDNELDDSDLLFPRHLVFPRQRPRRQRVELTEELLATLGTVTAPNGKEYPHGSINAYITAACRCIYCGQASADYRHERLVAKRQGPPLRDDDCPFVTVESWGRHFRKACTEAELPFIPKPSQLRHSHASWLINQGEDQRTVANRLGHVSLSTTNIYVHQVDNGESAVGIVEGLGLAMD